MSYFRRLAGSVVSAPAVGRAARPGAASGVLPGLRTLSPLAERDQRLHDPAYRERLSATALATSSAEADGDDVLAEEPEAPEMTERPRGLGVPAPVAPPATHAAESPIHAPSRRGSEAALAVAQPARVERTADFLPREPGAESVVPRQQEDSPAPRAARFAPPVPSRTSLPSAEQSETPATPAPKPAFEVAAQASRARTAGHPALEALSLVDRWLRPAALSDAQADSVEVSGRAASAVPSEASAPEAPDRAVGTWAQPAPASPPSPPQLSIGRIVIEVAPAAPKRPVAAPAPTPAARAAASRAAPEAWVNSSLSSMTFGWRQRS